MALTNRFPSPPPPETHHGVWCRIKKKLSVKPRVKAKLKAWGNKVDALLSNVNVLKPVTEAEARAIHDKKQEDKLAELETKRWALDKKIERLANEMRWERQHRPELDLTALPTPREHIQTLQTAVADAETDSNMGDVGSAMIKNGVKKALGLKRNEATQERAARHNRERKEVTGESEYARRVLHSHGIFVRDFQVELDLRHPQLTDNEASIIENGGGEFLKNTR